MIQEWPIFFNSDLIQSYINGEQLAINLTKFAYFKAKIEYERKRLFVDDNKVIKKYPDGFKWIDAGSKCSYTGKQMKNCGDSEGQLGEWDNTLIVLYDKNNKAHIIMTYNKANEVVSNIEGQAGTNPKLIYKPYIEDCVERVLKAENVRYDRGAQQFVPASINYIDQ